MNPVDLVAACLFLPLAVLMILKFLATFFGWLSGFRKLSKAYSWYGTTPPNTSRSLFAVGPFMEDRAWVGASEQGLYLHRGVILKRSVCIPWDQLRPVFSLWPLVVLRERRTRVFITVFQAPVVGYKLGAEAAPFV